jgi:hypothetical protein
MKSKTNKLTEPKNKARNLVCFCSMRNPKTRQGMKLLEQMSTEAPNARLYNMFGINGCNFSDYW